MQDLKYHFVERDGVVTAEACNNAFVFSGTGPNRASALMALEHSLRERLGHLFEITRHEDEACFRARSK